jgi:predicted dinucleotide-binding enzyme
MKVGILGSGDVGQTLGLGFAQRGHEVTIGSRTPDSKKLRSWTQKAGRNAKAATFSVAAQGEILVIAALGTAVDEVIKAAGPRNFEGKILIDATNPLDFSKGMPPGLFVGVTDSLGERIQRQLPRAKVVKCFNTVPNVLMVGPNLPGGKAEMLICGNDKKAKAAVTEILQSLGWSGALDVGGIDASRWLEALVPLWVRSCQAAGSWSACFQLVRG